MDRENIEVSYVIPSYRGKDLLPACLQSVFSQSSKAAREVIVVDDASDDGSAEMVRELFPEVRLIVNRSNLGPAAAKNVGAAQARGRFIAFLDNDVELFPDWEEAMLNRFAREGDGLAACASRLLGEEPRGRTIGAGGIINLLGHAWDRGDLGEGESLFRYPLPVAYACTAAMMVRREALCKVGGFDERLRYAYEDADLGWRLNIAGYDVLYEPRASAWHRRNTTLGSGALFNKYHYERGRLRSWVKNLETRTVGWLIREYLFAFLRQARREGREALSRRERWGIWGRMAQVVAWNLLFLPDTLRRRSRVVSLRIRGDGELIRRGLLHPHVGAPPHLGPRKRKEGRLPVFSSDSHPRKVVMGRRGEEALVEGWYEREKDGLGLVFRWTGQRAIAILGSRGGGKELLLRTRMGHPEGGSQAVVRVDGVGVGTIEVPNKLSLHHFPLPRAEQGRAREVEIEVLNPFRPREVLGVEDLRVLGIAVVSLELRG
ncbi:MAG: glycosyltransferase family 2 protein [Actinomycetota bacterium]